MTLPRLLAAAFAATLACTAQAQIKLAGGNAGGGPIAIDQAKAEGGGVSPDDTPGFPITISQPGSYRLMSNIVVPSLGSTAVLITSPGVTLDLNGFEIRGPNACQGWGASLSCPSMGMANNAIRGHGINVMLNDGPASVAIENGAVRGFAGYGLHASGSLYVYTARRMRVSHSGFHGVHAAGGLAESMVDRNVNGGVLGSLGVMHNQVVANRGSGVAGSQARFNTSWNNTQADTSNSAID